MSHRTANEESAGGILLYHSANGRQGLLIRVRSRGFEIPKGHIEAGETAEQAALRELREETALLSCAQAGPEIGALTYSFQSGERWIRKRVRYFRLLSLETPAFGPKPTGTRELLWVTREQAQSTALVSEALRPVILAALED